MNKREVILSLLEQNRAISYIPAAFFLHFGPEFKEGQPSVDKHLEFFRYTGMDLLKIQYERNFPPVPFIKNPGDWVNMPRYELDFYEGQLEAVGGLVKALKDEAVIVVTLYSPFMCAMHSTSEKFVIDSFEQDPEKTAKGLEIISDSLLVFVRECIKLGVDGFYTSTQGGEAGRFSRPDIFEKYIKPYDLVLMEEANRNCRFNILHVCDYQRDYDNFAPFLDYPGAVVSCPLQVGGKSITPAEAEQLFGRPIMGGLERKGTIATGTPKEIRQEVEQVIASAPERFILAADCTVPAETPWDNLKLAIDTAHQYK